MILYLTVWKSMLRPKTWRCHEQIMYLLGMRKQKCERKTRRLFSSNMRYWFFNLGKSFSVPSSSIFLWFLGKQINRNIFTIFLEELWEKLGPTGITPHSTPHHYKEQALSALSHIISLLLLLLILRLFFILQN